MNVARVGLRLVVAVLVCAPLVMGALGCGGENAAVKGEMKKTVISDESKEIQGSIAAKRKSERDFGKGKGRTPSGEAIGLESGK